MPTTQTSLLSFFAKGKGEGQGGNKRKQQRGENVKKQNGKKKNHNRSAKNENDNENQRKRRKTKSKEATDSATTPRATTKQRTTSLDEENQQDESSTSMKQEPSISCLKKEDKLEAAGVGKVEEVEEVKQDQRANDDSVAGHDKESITAKADPTSTGSSCIGATSNEGEKEEEQSSREDEDDDSSSSSDSDEDSDTDIEDKKQNDTTTNDDNDNIDENDNDNLCEYEKLRLRNIQRNNARLAALGLLKPGEAAGGQQFWPNNKKTRKVKRKKATTAPKANKTSTLPTRRSGRIRKTVLGGTDAAATTTTTSSSFSAETTVEELPPEEEVLVEYTVSPLLQYSMTDEIGVDSSSDSVAGETKSDTCTTTKEEETEAAKITTGNLSTLSPVGPRFCPPKGLNAIYSLDFWSTTTADNRNSWLVGAGKSGIISLWDTSNKQKTVDMNNDENVNDVDDDMIHPVFSWKGHSGRWISGAKLLSTSSRSSPTTGTTTATSTPSRLLTSSNDGTVCLWDLTKVTTTSNVPKLLYQTSKNLHRSGIFAMDVLQEGGTVRVCTGSKDTTIAVHSVDDYSSVLWRSDYHSGKVGSVQWQGTDGSMLLASASDDGLVAIHDYRITGSTGSGSAASGGTVGVVAEIGNAHARPHSVVWDKSSDHRFLTAGQDPIIKLWDLRHTNQPVTTLQGHVPSNSRCKGIHHPVFYKYGSTNFVLTGGDGSSALSMFSLNQQNNGESSSSSKTTTTTSGTLYSRGLLPLDCGDASAIAVGGSAATTTKVAVSVAGGEVLLLEPKLSRV